MSASTEPTTPTGAGPRPDGAGPDPAVGPPVRRDRRSSLTALTLVLAAACAGLAVAVSLGDDGFWQLSGLPVPAPGVKAATVAAKVLAVAATALAAGSLLVGGLLAAPQESGTVDVHGYRAVRRGTLAAGAAGVLAIGAAWLSVADMIGTAPSELASAGPVGWLGAAATLEEPLGWALAGVVLLLVTAGAAWTLSWKAVAALGAIAAAAVALPAAVHPAATGTAHDWSGDANVLRAVAGVAWLGIVAALVAHRTHGGALGGRTGARARGLLLVTGVVYLVGEVVLQLVVTTGGPLSGSAYVRTAVVVALLLVALMPVTALIGAGLRDDPGGRATGRWLPVGAVLGALVATLGVAGIRLVPPRFTGAGATALETLIGWDIEQPFTALTLLTHWRWNLLFGTGAVLLAVLYAIGVHRLAGRGVRWPVGRTWAWMLGCATLLLATSSGLGFYSPSMFSVHMISHMTLNMLAPILLSLGGAVTLALRVLRPAGRGNPPGPREWLLAGVHSRIARVLTHPACAAVLFVGSFYVLYFTPLFDGALRFHWSHQLMNLHFVLVGYLFFWPLIGVDSAPHRLPHLGRLAVMLATMPFHAFFGIAVMSSSEVLGRNFYAQVGLPWIDLLADQKVGGGIAWATGEIPMLLVMVTLVVQWSRDDSREAARKDRQAERDDDAELRAYNEMLSKLRQGG
ncbi:MULTISPECIES: cytochrome c oxidase assembly protein [unclassified Pseudonocardia]|uniref:cytochrome c oxidase assembly protein n=1 Tax=unclassified Pseudonocardia TaxID=2619320 RepID=UPI0009EC066A|nr:MULTISPECIES: cytochrome c oxidase assembly protein [unclassified Pseudonocardia]